MCGLQQALFSNCEADAASFISFSRGYHTQPHSSHHCEPLIPLSKRPIWQKIPLQKKQTAGDVLYVSAIPRLLLSNDSLESLLDYSETTRENSGKRSKKDLETISQQAIDQLKKVGFNQTSRERDHKDDDSLQKSLCYGNLLLQLWAEFQIETHRSGWIAFRLSDRGMGLWLAHMQSPFLGLNDIQYDLPHEPKLPAGKKKPLRLEKILWQMQYTYARCCRLLCLWQEVQPEATSPNLEFDATALPWLSASPSAGTPLIHSLIDVTDDLFWIPYQSSSQQYFLFLKRADQLCQAFELFYSRCLSGFGQLPQAFPPSVITDATSKFQTNFYLVAVTKNALKVLLSQYLSADAPACL